MKIIGYNLSNCFSANVQLNSFWFLVFYHVKTIVSFQCPTWVTRRGDMTRHEIWEIKRLLLKCKYEKYCQVFWVLTVRWSVCRTRPAWRLHNPTPRAGSFITNLSHVTWKLYFVIVFSRHIPLISPRIERQVLLFINSPRLMIDRLANIELNLFCIAK